MENNSNNQNNNPSRYLHGTLDVPGPRTANLNGRQVMAIHAELGVGQAVGGAVGTMADPSCLV